MPDDISRLIYKIEIDDSGYIRGVEALTQSTAKFTQEQQQANATLKTNEAALKVNTDRLNKAKADLDAYTGANARYRKQLENDVKSAEKDQQKLTEIVNQNRIAYEKATKAASGFANTSARAANVQAQAGGGKIPTPTVVQPVIPQLGAGIQESLKNISLGDLPETLQRTIPEFEALRAVIIEAKTRMGELNQEDEEFKQLAPIVAQGEEALRLYDQATQKTTGSQQSLRTQLRLGREELVKLEQAGKGASAEYFELEKRVAKLTDEFGDQQARIRILASDTKLLDFGKGAITAATSAFQAYTAVSILAGDQSEELQKKTMELFAAMQLLQSLEQLSNLTRREGVLATLAQSAAQSIYTTVIGTSTGALKAFRIALLATGILGAVAAIGFLVYKYQQMKQAAAEAAEKVRLLNTIRDKAIEGYAKEVAQLEILRRKLSDQNIPQNERIRLAKEYNTTAEESARIDLKQINSIDLLNAAIDRQIVKIKERALAQAAANVTEEEATKLFKAAEKVTEIAPKFKIDLPGIDRQIKNVQASLDDLSFKEWNEENVALTKHLQELKAALNDVKTANDSFNKSAKLAATIAPPQTCPEGYHWDASKKQCVKNETKETTTNKGPDNVFLEERRKQIDKLNELNRKANEDELSIRKQFEDALITENLRIQKLADEGKLTKPQKIKLQIEAGKVNETELKIALDEFNKKVADARKKLNDELRSIQQKSIQDSINLLQDEFEKRKQLIDFNEKKEIEDSKKNIDERLAALELDRLLLGEENYQKARAEIVQIGEQNVNNIVLKAANDRQGLSADIFKRSLELTEQILDEQLTQLDENTAEKIKAQKELLLTGSINYDQFQKELTKIQKDEKAERDKVRLQELQDELKAINDRIKVTTDVGEKEQLQARQRSVRRDIADIESRVDTTDPNKDKKEQLTAYVESVGQLTDAVIQFWAKANEAEQKALDRSIELQQKRVDAAQRIADRGNAQYLKEESDRLQELEVKRENAARKQLGIDAALQASQLLVGITGAIAKISTGIGAAETIAEIAVIVGALATGYGLVKSLQGNQPKLAEGTTYVSHPTAPRGRDKIPAWLNEGEAVFSSETNREYKPTVEAIYHNKIPSKTINEFVNNYVTNKSDHVKNFVNTAHVIDRPPELNIERIKETNEKHVTHDGKLAAIVGDQNRLLMENNDLQRQTLRAMKNMSVSATIDRDGIAISVNEYIQQMLINKRM